MHDKRFLSSRFQLRRKQRPSRRGIRTFNRNRRKSGRFIDGHNGIVLKEDLDRTRRMSPPPICVPWPSARAWILPHPSLCYQHRVNRKLLGDYGPLNSCGGALGAFSRSFLAGPILRCPGKAKAPVIIRGLKLGTKRRLRSTYRITLLKMMSSKFVFVE